MKTVRKTTRRGAFFTAPPPASVGAADSTGRPGGFRKADASGR
jgi:hypothetical protein